VTFAILSGFLRGVRFDDPASGNQDKDSQTFTHAIVRSIEKDNLVWELNCPEVGGARLIDCQQE
jgi:hypothetical protein